jgi:hypothetical protein
MDSIPLFSYLANYQPNPLGITLYNKKLEEIGKFEGTDIIDGYVYVHDGFQIRTREMKDCYVLDGE